MKKRIFSLILACTVLFSMFSINASAASALTSEDSMRTEPYERMYTADELYAIEVERNRIYDSVKAQLATQNAEDRFDVFKPIIDDLIDARYFRLNTNATDQVYAPNGGVVVKDSMMLGAVYTYIDKDETETIYNNRNNSSALDNVLQTLVDGLIFALESKLGPELAEYIGLLTGLLSIIPDYVNSQIAECVANGHGMYVLTALDKTQGSKISIVYEWVDEPWMDISKGIYDTVTYEKN